MALADATTQAPDITIGRVTYKVRLVPVAVKNARDLVERGYLVGPRGATYALVPNANNPEMCFPLCENPTGRRIGGSLDGWWFKLTLDADGKPVSVKAGR